MTFERITEEETKNLYITPAIRHAGWEPKQMRMETVINGVKENKYQFTPVELLFVEIRQFVQKVEELTIFWCTKTTNH